MHFYVLIILSITPIIIGYSTVETDPIETNQKSLEVFIERYFEKQKTVKIFNLQENDCNHVLSVLAKVKPVFFCDKPEFMQSIFKQNFGYFMISNEFNRDFLTTLDHISPNGPWFIHVVNDFNEELLRVAWDEFQMLHVTTVVFDTAIKMYVVNYYNPFVNVLYKDPLTDVNSIDRIVQNIYNRVRNLYGYKFKMFIVTDVWTYASPVYNRDGLVMRYEGIDGELVEFIHKGMNSDVDWIPFLYNETYYETMDRLRNLVLKRKLDMIAMLQTINYSSIDNVYPLNHIEPILIVGAMHMKRDTYLIDVLYGFADVPTCIMLYVLVFSLAATTYISAKLLKAPHYQDGFIWFYLEMLAFACGIARPIEKYVNTSFRLAFACALFLNITMGSVFQASIYKDLNVEPKNGQINSVSDLIRENISILAYDDFISIISNLENNTKYGNLKKKLILNYDMPPEDVFEQIADGRIKSNVGTLAFKNQAYFFRDRYLDYNTGTFAIHIMREPVLSVIMAFHVPTHSPFIEIMDEILIKALENGLRQKGENDANRIMYLDRIRTIKKTHSEGGFSNQRPKAITLENMHNIFSMYIWYCCLSIVVFMLEIIYFKLTKTKMCTKITSK